MPNWVTTIMEVTGPQGELDRFNGSIITEHTEEKVWDTTKNAYGDETVTKSAIKIVESFIPCPPQLYELPSPTFDEDERQRNIATYGAAHWYEWQMSNWGNKWGDVHTHRDDYGDEEEIVYRFDTAWGTLEKAFVRISELFPDLRFQFSYDEEAGFFAGSQVMKNGEIVYENIFSPSAEAEGIDWDDEASVEKYENWRRETQWLIDDEADKVAC